MYVKAGCLLLFLTGILPVKATNIELPNVTLIDNQLLQNLGVDNFFSFWSVFKNNNDIKISGKSMLFKINCTRLFHLVIIIITYIHLNTNMQLFLINKLSHALLLDI